MKRSKNCRMPELGDLRLYQRLPWYAGVLCYDFEFAHQLGNMSRGNYCGK